MTTHNNSMNNLVSIFLSCTAMLAILFALILVALLFSWVHGEPITIMRIFTYIAIEWFALSFPNLGKRFYNEFLAIARNRKPLF